MSHKHCIFCGEEVPVPRPTNWSLECDSPLNNISPDTAGRRYHAVIVGSAKREINHADNNRNTGGVARSGNVVDGVSNRTQRTP